MTRKVLSKTPCLDESRLTLYARRLFHGEKLGKFHRRKIDRDPFLGLHFGACAPHFLLFHFLLWILVFHGITGIRDKAFSLPRKNDFGVFSALCKSKGFYAAKTESCCIKHTLLFAPAQINPSVKDGSRVSQKRTLYASKTSVYRLGAKLLSLVPKSLIFYEATNTQIEATSTQLAKRVEKELRRHLYLPRRRANRRCPPSQKSLIGMRSFSRICIANTYGTSTNAIEGMYLRTTVQLF